MLSLHPQDFNNNPCHLPYRSLVAPSSIGPETTTYFPHFTMSGGSAIQSPPTPQHEADAPLSPRSRPATASSSSSPGSSDRASCSPLDSLHMAASTPQAAGPSPAAAAVVTTISPPADYSNLDPNVVAEALEVARDSPDGARDPVVSGILESALSQIWDRVTAGPESYVMTTGEFAVFNFYQHRFMGNKLAIAARRRFWDNAHV